MATTSEAIAKYDPENNAVLSLDVRRELQIQTLNSFRDLTGWFREIAETAFAAGMVPQGIRNYEGALIAIWRGAEVGLLPQQSLQSIFIVNGMPQLYGDAPVGIVEASGLLEDRTEIEEGTFPQDDYTWKVTVKRRGHSVPRISKFTIGDAKTAKLWGKVSDKGVASPWVLYPKRMLLWRARGYALRDEFPDVLKGFPIRELLDDDEALFSAARPLRVVEPNLPKPEDNEPVKPRRGRPPKASEPTAEPLQSAQAAPEPAPKPETPAPASEPPEGAPKAAEGSPSKGSGGLFSFSSKAEPAKPEPPKLSGLRQNVAKMLSDANFSQKEFILLLGSAGLLGPEVDAAQIETGTVNLGNVPEHAIKEAVEDWADVLKALQQKPWEHAHDDK